MEASTTARGYLPPVERVGNVVFATVEPGLAWRLGEAARVDPYWRLRLLEYIEGALREYCDDIGVPGGQVDVVDE